jgi:hypothetical protein
MWVPLQLVFSVLAIVRSEILWYFCHVGIIFGKSKGTRFIPIEMVCNFFSPDTPFSRGMSSGR